MTSLSTGEGGGVDAVPSCTASLELKAGQSRRAKNSTRALCHTHTGLTLTLTNVPHLVTVTDEASPDSLSEHKP